MSIDIGRMNKRISFVKMMDTDAEGNPFENELGQTIQKPVMLRTVWASIEPVSGKELMEAQKIRPELTYKIYTRYFKDITPDMVIRYKEREFQIISTINYRENNEMLQFVCIEKVGDTIV